MSNFEDGSYSSVPGTTLIAKVLAGRGTIKYTRAAVGKGKIPEGETPKTMTTPAEYVMDAQIASVTNPVDGECQVTVQINSANVKNGFYATGIILYAEDPDEGEIPYTYLVLENGPEWIRPSSSVVGKIATFDLIAAVGGIDKVTAVVDPSAMVTRAEAQRLINDALIGRSIVIPQSGWQSYAEDMSLLYLDTPLNDITERTTAIVSIMPTDIKTADACGLYPTVESFNGFLRFYAKTSPDKDISANLALISTAPETNIG